MPPLNNARHERFVQLLLQGESAVDAHEKAGFVRSDGNASRLKASPKIAARLAELQTQAASEAKVTVESICRELDEANAVAKARGQAAAMVSASALRAKLAGLMVDKVEVGAAGDFSKCDSVEGVVDELLQFGINAYHDLRSEDRDYLVALFQRCFEEAGAYIEEIKSRPYITIQANKLPKLINGPSKRP